MYLVYTILILMNCLTEYQLNKMMMSINVFSKKNLLYHILCAILRVVWISLSAFFSVPIVILLIGLLVLLFLNIIPYRKRLLLMSNFTMIIYLLYVSLFMFVTGIVGLLGIDFSHLVEDKFLHLIILNTTFLFHNIICFLLLHYRPEFLWNEEIDRLKVVIYSRFLLICSFYHILDALLLTFYEASQVVYLLLVSGDLLILILMFNFLAYNYVFVKSELMKKEYEESEILIAQKYFEKETLKELSEHDALTNAYNRREICSFMQEKMQNGHQLICVFIDLDGLKIVNDRYGHFYGDMMLKRFASSCMSVLDGKGNLARIGGDEFLLVFLDLDIQFVENCIIQLQDELLKPDDDKEKIYFSYGISFDEHTVDDYIVAADKKMYICKKRKRSELNEL